MFPPALLLLLLNWHGLACKFESVLSTYNLILQCSVAMMKVSRKINRYLSCERKTSCVSKYHLEYNPEELGKLRLCIHFNPSSLGISSTHSPSLLVLTVILMYYHDKGRSKIYVRTILSRSYLWDYTGYVVVP